jgi:broad specificity phosphatase PhoE
MRLRDGGTAHASVTTLLLVRHGETEWNRVGRWQGGSDTDLNDVGRRQARVLADGLDEAVDLIYSSDLKRARGTAEIIADRLGLQIRIDPRLRERGFGAWEGLTSEEVEERFADDYRRWRAGEGAGAADAEPLGAFAARIHGFLDDTLLRHPADTVLVITHGGAIRVIQALATGVDYLRDRRSVPGVANCVVARYAARDGKLAPVD